MNQIRLARLVAAAELPIVIGLSPALLFPTPKRLLILCVIPIVWSSSRAAGGTFLPRTPMNAALAVLLVMVAVSLYVTFDVRFSLGKISGVLLGILLFWAIVRWVTSAERLKLGVAAFLLAGGCLALLGLLGTHHGEFEHPASWAARWPLVIRGVPGAEDGFNPNAVAGCLVLFLPLQVALLATGAQRWLLPYAQTRSTGRLLRAAEVGLFVLTAGTTLLMRSRGAVSGLAVATIALLLLHSRRARVAVAIATVGLIVLVTVVGPESLLRLALADAGPNMKETVSIRMALWSRAITGIRDFPLTGMGMNVARTVLPVRPPHRDMAHAHNHLLQAALDLGIPGLIAYASIWILAGALLGMVYARSGDRTYRVMAIGLGAGLIAHFVFGLTDAIPLGAKVGVLYWLTLALSVALHQVSQTPVSPDRRVETS